MSVRSKQEADCQGHVSATVKWRERTMNMALLDCEREREARGRGSWQAASADPPDARVIRAQSRRMAKRAEEEEDPGSRE